MLKTHHEEFEMAGVFAFKWQLKYKIFFFFVTVSTCECIKEDFATTFFIALHFLVNIQMSVHILHEKNIKLDKEIVKSIAV